MEETVESGFNPMSSTMSQSANTAVSKHSVSWSTIPRFLFAPIGLVGMFALAFSWPNDHWLTWAFWTLLVSYSLFCWTSCVHEAAHHTLGGSKRWSIIIGRFIGTMIFVPFHVYRESHIRHHAYLNKSTDWELWPYSDPNASLWFRRIFCWLEIPFGFLTSPFVYGRLYFHKDSSLQNPEVRRLIRNEYIVIAIVWTAILTLVTLTSSWHLFLVVWIIPHVIAGVYQTFRKFTEHLGMRSYDPLLGTRTVIGSSPITAICTYFNFDIFVHGPHHRHPRYRHEALCDRMAQYEVENPSLDYPIFKTYWGAIRDLIPSLIWNPGVGMNVGAPPPSEERPHDVSDFSEDVTAQILGEKDAVIEA